MLTQFILFLPKEILLVFFKQRGIMQSINGYQLIPRLYRHSDMMKVSFFNINLIENLKGL